MFYNFLQFKIYAIHLEKCSQIFLINSNYVLLIFQTNSLYTLIYYDFFSTEINILSYVGLFFARGR